MLWSTHERIAGKIAEELKLNYKETDCLKKGSIRPDYWKDYPHHYGKERQIRKHIVEARRLFVNDQKLEAIFSLGVALHYIQDRLVTVPGSDERHVFWEHRIDESPFVRDMQEMIADERIPVDARMFAQVRNVKKEYVEMTNRLLEFSQLCQNNFKGHDGVFAEATTLNLATVARPGIGTPIFDLNFAYRISLLVALSVSTSKTNSIISEKLEQIRKEFELELKDAEEDLARKLVELKYMSTELQRRRGFIVRLKRLICSLKIWVNRRRYEKGSHLISVQTAYYRKAKLESKPFSNWYKVTIPELDIEQVERLLPEFLKSKVRQ